MRFLLLLFFTVNLMALSIDPLLLKAQASIFPKIMLLDNGISSKTVENKLVLAVVYNDKEHTSAKKLKALIDKEYKNSLGELTFEVRLVHITAFDKQPAAAYYLFDTSSSKMKDVVSHAKKTHRVCFGYNYKDFDQNILISLFLKEKTYIYLNKVALQEYNIKFAPILYRIVKVVE